MTGTWSRRLRDNGVCTLLLFLLPLSVHLMPWLNGEVSVDPNSVLALTPWSTHTSTELTPPSSLSAWQLRSSWPSYRFLSAGGQTLSELQWNPDIGLGVPFFANPENRCLSPFSIWFYWLDFDVALLLSILSKGILAGWIAYYVARRYGFTPWYALIVALIFQWSGPVFLWGMEPLSDSIIWLPLLLLSTDRLILGQFRAWPGVALVSALMIFSGDVRLFIASSAVMLVYMALRRMRDHKRAHVRGAFPGYALGVTAGLGLAAIQLLPYVELLREGNAVDHLYPWNFDASLLLGIFGPAYYQGVTGENNPLVHLVFVGTIPVLFVGLWMGLRKFIERPIRHRVESLLFASLAVASVPVIAQELLTGIHGLRFLHPAHYLAVLSLPLSFLVAGVAESWLHLDAEQCKRALRRMALILPVFWGTLMVLFIVFGLKWSGTTHPYWTSLGILAGTGLVVLLLFGSTLLYPKARILLTGTIALLVVNIIWGTVSWQPRAQRADVFPETDVIQALQMADGRVGGTNRAATWPFSGNQIPALYAPSTVALNRTDRFLKQMETDPLLQRRAAISTLLLQKDDIQGAYAPVRADLNIMDIFDSGLVLFRDLGAESRYRIVHEIDGASTAIDQLQGTTLPVVPGVQIPPLPGPVTDAVRVIDVPRNDALDLEVETSHPGVLIDAGAWYPGWKAEVDGAPVAIVPVDGVFRGIELRTGTHTVRFRYQSDAFRWGMFISLGSLAVFLAGFFLATRRTKRHY